MKLFYPLSTKNNFLFNPTPRDFIVNEVPLYEFSGDGEHLILYIRKKNLTTQEMIKKIASYLSLSQHDVGYAGLKDKNAMTMQYISIPFKFQDKIKDFNNENIKIISTNRHNNKIKIGHLKGNHFKIRLKQVFNIQKDKLNSTIKWIKQSGMPNYFGHQRFGNDGDNWKDGLAIIEGKKKFKDRKINKFLINSYQSYLFNQWLSKRVEISILLDKFSEKEVEKIFNLNEDDLKNIKKQLNFFKILDGDLMMHYPNGKVFEFENIEDETKRFKNFEISPTGLLSGERVLKSKSVAKTFESEFETTIDQFGARRFAWIKVEDIVSKYVLDKAQYELSFFLPKGAYATILIDFLRGI